MTERHFDNEGLVEVGHLSVRPELRRLSVQGNGILCPQRLPVFRDLEFLDLSYNGPWKNGDLRWLKCLPRLKELRIDGNGLTSLQYLELSNTLHSLSVAHNRIAETATMIAKSLLDTNLQAIDICGNPSAGYPDVAVALLRACPKLMRVDKTQRRWSHQSMLVAPQPPAETECHGRDMVIPPMEVVVVKSTGEMWDHLSSNERLIDSHVTSVSEYLTTLSRSLAERQRRASESGDWLEARELWSRYEMLYEEVERVDISRMQSLISSLRSVSLRLSSSS